MNIVDLVTSQLTGDVLSKLGGAIGANESQTRSATSAAVPALLTAFSKLASNNAGASQMANALGGLDLKTLGNLASLLGGGQSSSLGNIGGSLLTSLLGNNLGSLAGTLASFAGLQPGIMKTLLTYLAPVVMGVIANQFKGAKPDAAGLMRLFSEQQDNIKAALPRGLSLADFDTSSASPRRAEESRGGHQHDQPASGFPIWLPLLLLGLLGLGALAFWPRKQEEPRGIVVEETRRREGPVVVDTTTVVEQVGKKVAAVTEEKIELAPEMVEALKVGKDLTGLFGSLSKVLGGVTNEETARAAIPQLEELAPMLKGVQEATDKLPADGRTSIVGLITENLGGLQKVIDTVMAIPGVKDVLGPTVTSMMESLTRLAT